MLPEHPHMKVVRREAVVELIGQRIAAVSARLATERAKPEPDTALLAQLEQQCVDMTKEQWALNSDDEAGVEAVRRRYAHYGSVTSTVPPGLTMDRVKAALAGRFDADQLEPAERVYFDEALGSALAEPSPDSIAFFAEHRRLGIGVGVDETGRLVRARPDGGFDVLPEDDDVEGLSR